MNKQAKSVCCLYIVVEGRGASEKDVPTVTIRTRGRLKPMDASLRGHDDIIFFSKYNFAVFASLFTLLNIFCCCFTGAVNLFLVPFLFFINDTKFFALTMVLF
jgi:hypothetical protein